VLTEANDEDENANDEAFEELVKTNSELHDQLNELR